MQAESFANDGQSSFWTASPATVFFFFCGEKACSFFRQAKTTIAVAVVGIRNTTVPFSPQAVRAAAAIIGPRANPILPPTAKMLSPEPLFSPAKRPAILPPSGWKSAIPTPETTTAEKMAQ